MASVPLTIRPAAIEDAEGIARVHVLSWQAAYRGLVPDEHLEALDIASRGERWAIELADSPGTGYTTLVAVDAGTVVGFVRYGPARDDDVAAQGCTEITAIYAVPAVWGTGVGSLLLAAVKDAVPAEAGCLLLWVLTGNARGRAFYERAGFAPDGAAKVEVIGGARLQELRYRLPVA